MGAAEKLQFEDVRTEAEAPPFRYEYANDFFWITVGLELAIAVTTFFKPLLIPSHLILDVNFLMPLVAYAVAREIRGGVKYYLLCSAGLPVVTLIVVSLAAGTLLYKGIPLAAMKILWMLIKGTLKTWGWLQAVSIPCALVVAGLKYAVVSYRRNSVK